MYSIQTLTPPASEPVSLAELKEHIRLDDGDAQDDLLSAYITAAREHFELGTDGCIVLPTTFVQRVWDYGDYGIELMRGNVSAVSSVTYYDNQDDVQTLSGWSSDITGTPAVVYLPGRNYPALSAYRSRPLVVQFVAGWANVAAIPQTVRVAIMNLAAHFNDVRLSHALVEYKDVPMGFKRVCELYRTGLGGL